MADDLSSAPTSGSEPASPSVDSTPAPAPEAKADKPLSNRDAIRQAMAQVETRQPNETEKAAAVLKEGAGADDQLVEDRRTAAQKAVAETEATNAAAERARKGWETRRANQEKAEAETAQAQQIDKAVAEKVKEATATTEAKPAEAKPIDTKHPDAPKWMTKQAAGEWAKLPEVMREEIVKRSEAFDKGITQYKQSADRWNELQDYEKLSQEAYGRPLKETLEAYIEIDKGLTSDPLGTIEEKILKPMGYTLRQVAEHVMGQEPSDSGSEIAELRMTVADLNRQLSAVTSDITNRQRQEAQQRQTSVLSQVEAFAKENARFDELFPDMETFLSSPKFEPQLEGIARLKAAYERAERLNPAPSFSPPAPDIPAPNSAAQTRAGTASVSGAPGSGSNPAAKKLVPSTNRDAIRQALGRVGLAHS